MIWGPVRVALHGGTILVDLTVWASAREDQASGYGKHLDEARFVACMHMLLHSSWAMSLQAGPFSM